MVSMNLAPYVRGDSSRTYGGAEVQGAFLAGALRRAGHDVRIIVSDLGDEPFPFDAIEAFDSSAGIRGLRFVHPRITGIWRALARADADVYYQRNAGMVTAVVAAFCRMHGRTFVYGAGSDVDFSLRRNAAGGPRDRVLFSLGVRASHGVVVQNRAQERAARRAVPGWRVCRIPNGVEPEPEPREPGGRYVAWVGALWRIKRPDRVLDLARRLPDVPFVVVGGKMAGEPDVADAIARRAHGLGNVRLTGRIPHARVREVLREAAVLVNTSEVEGFPNAYLEAWACGVPVVTLNDVDGIVADAGVGVVCASLDEQAAAVRDLVQDAAKRREMGRRARRLVDERFAPEPIARRYTAFFASLREGAVNR